MDIVFLVLMFLGASLVLVSAVNEKNNKESMDINKVINKIPVIVKEIEEMHCKMTDTELLRQKLTKEDIKKVREFCNLPTAEKEKILREKFSKIKEKKTCKGKIVNRSNSYSCW